jgi:hypothetical protein
VQVGQECGMAFENYEDIRAGDVIECFRVEEFENYSKIDALLRSPEVARDLDHDDDADETGDGAGSEGEGKA